MTSQNESKRPSQLKVNTIWRNKVYFYPFIGIHESFSDDYFKSNLVLIEQILRLTFLLIKVKDDLRSQEIIQDIHEPLCEIIIKTDVQRIYGQTRKLLLLICGSRGRYKALKDDHIYKAYTRSLVDFIKEKIYETTNYIMNKLDYLLKVADDLKLCLENALLRPNNWEIFCMRENYLVSYLMECANETSEEVLHSILLKLIQIAIVSKGGDDTHTNEKVSYLKIMENLESQIRQNGFKKILENFLKKFLRGKTNLSLKNLAHSIVSSMMGFNDYFDDFLFCTMWKLFEESNFTLSKHFIDILCAVTYGRSTKISGDQWSKYMDHVLVEYFKHNKTLQAHPSAHIYTHLHDLMEIDGYYFDNDSCFQCLTSNDTSPAPLRLTSIKFDVRFTPSSVLVRLTQSYSIHKIILKIGDLKKNKMLRKLNIYYNNLNTVAIAELRSKQHKWKKAKSISVASGQTEICIEFILPITACNLMFEYSDFYSGTIGCTETIQCPRCSATVSTVPGVCSNCGENVFQCHKCRSINYDEKVSFLLLRNYTSDLGSEIL